MPQAQRFDGLTVLIMHSVIAYVFLSCYREGGSSNQFQDNLEKKFHLRVPIWKRAKVKVLQLISHYRASVNSWCPLREALAEAEQPGTSPEAKVHTENTARKMTQSRRSSRDGNRYSCRSSDQSLPPPPSQPTQGATYGLAALKEEILNDVKHLLAPLLPA